MMNEYLYVIPSISTVPVTETLLNWLFCFMILAVTLPLMISTKDTLNSWPVELAMTK